MPKPKLSAEEFVKIWCTSKSLSEVQARTGRTRKTLSVRATQYRRRGVDLPKFARGCGPGRTDWLKVAALADELTCKDTSE